jgi:hypothetical protein
MSNIVYLSVPYSDKDQAKSMGAKWNPAEKKWYAPNGEKSLIEKWGVNVNPVILTGEDLTFGGNNLFVDLVPSSCWFKNARKNIHPRDWDRVREYVYRRTNYICECCGINTKAKGIQLDAHERWDYNHDTQIQKLVRLIALCENCHSVTHIGLAGILGKRGDAMKHLKTVRKFTDLECEEHIKKAFELWSQRSKCKWNLDLSLLTNNGISIINIENNS